MAIIISSAETCGYCSAESVQVTHAGKAASSQMWDQPFNRIFYNRVPKCGSRTVHAVLRHVQRGSDRKFTLYLHPLNDMRPFSEKEQVNSGTPHTNARRNTLSILF